MDEQTNREFLHGVKWIMFHGLLDFVNYRGGSATKLVSLQNLTILDLL